MVNKLAADFLKFVDISDPKNKTKKFEIVSTHSGDYLAYIAWDCGWRRYVINFDASTKWSVECLRQAYKFVAQLMQDRNKSRDIHVMPSVKTVIEINKELDKLEKK